MTEYTSQTDPLLVSKSQSQQQQQSLSLPSFSYGSTEDATSSGGEPLKLDQEDHKTTSSSGFPTSFGDNYLTNNNNSDDPTVTSAPNSVSDDEGGSATKSNFAGWSLRRIALELSLYLNLIITVTKLIAYLRTMSLSVLAALLDSVLDVVSQVVLNYTEKHSSLQRSSAFYPAGAARLEPIGVLTCAALMGMASFEVLKDSFTTLIFRTGTLEGMTYSQEVSSFWSMIAIVVVKVLLLQLCTRASHRRSVSNSNHNNMSSNNSISNNTANTTVATVIADATMEALAQDHYNDALSNGVAAAALVCALYSRQLWFVDPVGAILISLYIIYSWYHTGKEQIEHLTGKSAPEDFIEELLELADNYDERMVVDTCRAYHFGPKFLVELEVVLPRNTLLFESHDLGMELQYEIEGREEVERCFVHIDYETRDYDEHVVSKVPHLREILRQNCSRKSLASHASV
jgi:cation diffusion facilitator family transporter